MSEIESMVPISKFAVQLRSDTAHQPNKTEQHSVVLNSVVEFI